ncbi:F-box protein [Phanerochaete sordida]|uniref:F-box protein n=1 Tax=Phanerochaete sordida TaxID=48140 RepID=A0A9P3G4H6_9APHY|nr:F-box protein [Phanerochaete sordida]
MTTIHDVELAFDNFIQTAHACTARIHGEAGSLDIASTAGTRASLAIGDANLAKLVSIVLRLKDGKMELRRIRLDMIRERNSYTLISRLPVELLQLVFEHHDALSTHMEDPRVTHPALVISAVCSHWRAVTLHHPVLWTRINVVGGTLHWLNYLRGHAKDLPLTISYLPSDDTGGGERCSHFWHVLAGEHLCDFVKAELPRTRDLTFRLLPTETPASFFNGTSASALERCTLSQAQTTTRPLPISVLAPFLVSHSTVRLHHLQLESVDADLSPSLLSQNLTSLILLRCRLSLPHPRGWFLILESIPKLELLVVDAERCVSAGHPPEFEAEERFEMVQLNTLKLRLPVEHACHLISHLSAPNLHTCHIELHPSVASADAAFLANIWNPDVLQPVLFPGIAHLWLKGEYTDGSSMDTIIEGLSDRGEHVLRLRWQVTRRDSDLGPVPQLTRYIDQYQPSLSAHTLTIDCRKNVYGDMSPLPLLRLPSLHALVFVESVVGPLLLELADGVTSPNAINSLPTVSRLSLRHCNLGVASLEALSQWCRGRRTRLRELILDRVEVVVRSRQDIQLSLQTVVNLAETVQWTSDPGLRFSISKYDIVGSLVVESDVRDCRKGREYTMRKTDGSIYQTFVFP